MTVAYQTARLTLREFTAADVPLLFELDSDPDVRRHVHMCPPTSLEPYRERVARCRRYYAESPGLGYWAAEDAGGFVGWFHLRPALDYVYAEACGYRAGDLDLGYRLRQAAWGRGYATEGSRALVEAGFAGGAARVVACALLANAASWRVMEKVGMARLAEVRLPGIELPAVVFAVGQG